MWISDSSNTIFNQWKYALIWVPQQDDGLLYNKIKKLDLKESNSLRQASNKAGAHGTGEGKHNKESKLTSLFNIT